MKERIHGQGVVIIYGMGGRWKSELNTSPPPLNNGKLRFGPLLTCALKSGADRMAEWLRRETSQ